MKAYEGGETTVEVVVEVGERLVHGLSDFATLERRRSREDRDF